VITSQATFSEYTFASKLFGGQVCYVPMTDGMFQVDRFFECIDSRTKAVFLCNPNNPTGTYFNQKTLEGFLAKVSPDVLVIVDEAYCEYVQAPDFPLSLKLIDRYPNLLVLRTFSKIYGLAGLRVGYAVGAPEIIGNLHKAREPFNVNSVAQAAAYGALDDDAFLKKSIAVNEQGKQYLYREFDKLGLKYHRTEANFVFVYIGQDCMQAFAKLMDLGVTIRPMKSFGFDDAIRVTIGTPEQNDFFIKALNKIL
jgi:histidinol-phosphate aminotransferase